jgi:hypothetical protein
MAERASQTFYTEDVCMLKGNRRNNMGIIERTPSDVDTHTPNPERDYLNLKAHKDVGRVDFERFKRTGIVSFLLFSSSS